MLIKFFFYTLKTYVVATEGGTGARAPPTLFRPIPKIRQIILN